MTGRTAHIPAGVGARAAHIQTHNRRAMTTTREVGGEPTIWLARMIRVTKIAVGDMQPLFDVGGCVDQPVNQRIPEVGCILCYQVDQLVADPLAQISPTALCRMDGQKAHPHRDDMFACGGDRRIVHCGNLHVNYWRVTQTPGQRGPQWTCDSSRWWGLCRPSKSAWGRRPRPDSG